MAKTNSKAPKPKTAAKPIPPKAPAKPADKAPKPKAAPKPPVKVPLRELRPDGKMTARKLAGLTDQKGLTTFLLNCPFKEVMAAAGPFAEWLRRRAEAAACPSVDFGLAGLTVVPFAIGRNGSVTVKVSAKVEKLAEMPPEPVSAEPAAQPKLHVPEEVPAAAPEPPVPAAESADVPEDEFEPVAAEVKSPDGEEAAKFDCQQWLRRAADDDIANLVREGYAAATAYEVAWFYVEIDPKVKAVFDYAAKTGGAADCRCSVDEEQLLDWVEQFRPHLMERLGEIQDDAKQLAAK